MSTRKHIFAAVFTCFFILMVGCSPAHAADPEWIVLHSNLPKDAQRITVNLSFNPSNSQFYQSSKQNIKSQPVDADKEGWQQQIDLGTFIDGNRYTVKLKGSNLVNIITENSEQMCIAAIQRITDRKTEVINEGLIVLNRELSIPLTVSPKQLHIPTSQPVQGTALISISSNGPVYQARCRTVIPGTLSGSASIHKMLLDTTITAGDSLNINTYTITLILKAFDDPASRHTTSAPMNQMLTLGAATVVVEKMMSNGSQMVLAISDGELGLVTEQRKTGLTVGKPFPDFARVELVQRRLVTLDTLVEQAGPNGSVVLLFGDLKKPIPPQYGRPPQPGSLPLDETMAQEILRKDVQTPVVIGFVCRQVSLSDLYEKWLGRNPDFHILSDYSDPLNTRFEFSNMDPHMYRQNDNQSETLRGKLGIDHESVAAALIDANKNTVYFNANAAGRLADVLVEMNNLLKDRISEPADN